MKIRRKPLSFRFLSLVEKELLRKFSEVRSVVKERMAEQITQNQPSMSEGLIEGALSGINMYGTRD